MSIIESFARQVRGTALMMALLAAPASASEPVLGELPASALSTFEVRDVGAEVCLRHVFRPDAIDVDMPNGFRLARLSERASAPWIADLLLRRPELQDWAHGSFCFIEAGVHTVDGRPLYPAGQRSKVAFMWADMAPLDVAPSDPRFLGPMRRVQIFWLYDSEGVDRDLARRATPDALFGRITMERIGESWRVGIEGDESRLAAFVTPTTARQRLEYPMPGFETVPLSGSARDHFHIVTFAGHHEQHALGEWRASGNAIWARGFANERIDAGSFIQDGFAAKLGLYRFEP